MAIRRAVEHLGTLGHDTITYLAGPEASWAEGMRWRALREAAHELELRVRRVDPRDDPTMRTGHAAARRIADDGATAVLAYNDALAIGVIKGLTQLGVRVPGDVSVVGFDNVLLADVVDPALTTVAAPMRKAGALGVGNVLALAAGAQIQRRDPGAAGEARGARVDRPRALAPLSAAGTASPPPAAPPACPGRPRTPPTSTDAGSR